MRSDPHRRFEELETELRQQLHAAEQQARAHPGVLRYTKRLMVARIRLRRLFFETGRESCQGDPFCLAAPDRKCSSAKHLVCEEHQSTCPCHEFAANNHTCEN